MKTKTIKKVPQRKPVAKMTDKELEQKILNLVAKNDPINHRLDDDYSLPKRNKIDKN